MRKMRDSSKTSCSVLLRACAEARSRPNGFSTTTRAPGHGVEGRKDLLVGEVAARPEDDEAVGARRAHLPGPLSTWPPNSNRMAESRRSWKSASPLEAKRSKSAAAST